MEPLRILITGAAGQIAYSTILSICNGDIFGKEQTIILHLLGTSSTMNVLHGVLMEIQDMSLPLIKDTIVTDNYEQAFTDIDVAILLGSIARNAATKREQLLDGNARISKNNGIALNKFAKKSVKVLVISNPVNTNCYIVAKYASSIPRENFTCLTRLDHNRAKAQIAHRLKVSPDTVKNLISWGNHSSTQYPDARYATVNIDGKVKSVYEAVDNDSWLHHEFVSIVRERGKQILEARHNSSSMSAARAIIDHMSDWWNGTNNDEWVSMGVISDGSYGIEEGLVFSFPVRIQNGQYSIVSNLVIDNQTRRMLNETQNELILQRDEALKILNSDELPENDLLSKI